MIARIAWYVLVGFNCLTVAVLLVPLVVSVLVSFTPAEFVSLPETFSLRWYREFFGDWQWMESLSDSFVVAILTIIISVPIGTATAIAFTRYRFKWRAAASTVIMLPLFVPPVIIGLGSLTFHRAIGIWGTHFSIAVAHSLWAMPLVFIVLQSTLRRVDVSVEEAAAGLGASPVRVFFEITLPLVASGIFVGTLFAFIISMNDLIMALFLSTADIKTMPVVIWPQIRYLLTPIVAAASSVIIVITVGLLIVAARVTNIRRLADFRS